MKKCCSSHRLPLSQSSLRRLSSSTPPPPPPSADAATSSASIPNESANASPSEASESLFSSSAVPEPAAPEVASENLDKKESNLWKLFRIFFAGSVVAGTAGSAYVTYAFSSEQIENRISALRHRVEATPTENDSLLQRVHGVLLSTSLKAAASVAELYLEIRKSIEDQVRGFAAPTSDKLLPDLAPQERHVFTLVLDLNETLVYSDWKRDRGWRTFKRPGVDAFLEHLAQYYELVVYSDQLSFYVDPILERLDQKGCIRYRLSREATQYVHGKHYRDLSKLNRDPSHVIYLSAHASETCLQPENALTVKPWKLDTDDTTLLDLLPFFEYVARYRPADIRPVLSSYSGHDIPAEFRERTREYQRKMREIKQQNPFFRGSTASR